MWYKEDKCVGQSRLIPYSFLDDFAQHLFASIVPSCLSEPGNKAVKK